MLLQLYSSYTFYLIDKLCINTEQLYFCEFMVSYILCFLWAFLIAVFAIPSIINVAHIKRLLDEPNLRTVHSSLTPRLGGIAIFAGLTSSITIFGVFDKEIQQILAACIILFFIGLKDDIVTLSTFKKFFVQVLAAGIVVFIGDIRITNFYGFLGWNLVPEGISYAFSFLVIVGIINAVNLIDGLDGLAGSVSVLMCVIFITFFLMFPAGNSEAYVHLALALVGGLLGFLRYNFYKAIIFMGDTGSMVTGFIIAILAIKFINYGIIDSPPSVAVSIVILPIIDTIRVSFIRILTGKSPFSPDKNHIHHILKAKGLTSVQIVGILCAVNLIFFFATLALSHLGTNITAFAIMLLAALLYTVLEWFKKSRINYAKHHG